MDRKGPCIISFRLLEGRFCQSVAAKKYKKEDRKTQKHKKRREIQVVEEHSRDVCFFWAARDRFSWLSIVFISDRTLSASHISSEA